MALEWKLREIMAKKEVWNGSELLRIMEDTADYRISASSISALINEKPKMIRVDTLDALCTALDCKPNDLIVYTNTSLDFQKQKKME